VNFWLNHRAPGSSIYLKPMVWMASALDGINPSMIRPEDSAAKWKKLALVIQASNDRTIPLAHAQRLSKAAHCPLWIVQGAKHAQCYEFAHDEYARKVKEFVKNL